MQFFTEIHYFTMCPAGHQTIQSHDPVEAVKALTSPSVTLSCGYCGERWQADEEVIEKIQNTLEMRHLFLYTSNPYHLDLLG
jgi:hypothetical protein